MSSRPAGRSRIAAPNLLRTRRGQLGLCLGGMAVTAGLSYAEYLAHITLPTALSLHFTVVVLAALQWGFLQSTAMAVMAVVCLDFFFTSPVLTLTMQDPQNWIALTVFEAAALLVSGLSAKMRADASEGEIRRKRTAKLYQLSRSILLIDGRSSTSEQLAALIREFMQVEEVAIWTADDTRHPNGDHHSISVDSAFATYAADRNRDEPTSRTSWRVLRIGTTPTGGLVLRGWETDPLLADAVASLAAIAVERARSMAKENRAEVARNAEQLRTAVLDGLAHGFKTPLTAIQTASSGLLTIGHLNPVQAELASIIDEQAALLTNLSTRLLQTAALESKDVRLRRSTQSLPRLVEQVIGEQDTATQARVSIHAQGSLSSVEVDTQLLELALLQLVDNAAKYSAVGSPILVTITQDESETMVVVENEGSSIRPADQARIFDRFYRGGDSTHGPTGTGLGLSIVRKTAEAHGGRTWVESKANRTRFFFTISGGKRVER